MHPNFAIILSQTSLVAIHKIRVLFVCEVLESRSIEGFGIIPEVPTISQRTAYFLFSSIFPLESEAKDEEQNKLNHICN